MPRVERRELHAVLSAFGQVSVPLAESENVRLSAELRLILRSVDPDLALVCKTLILLHWRARAGDS